MTSYLVLLGILVCFSAILALALNFQWGLGGMVNFGLTGFYALGAYASALFMLKAGANSFFAVVGAMAVVAAVCAVVAFVTLRVTEEDYFAIGGGIIGLAGSMHGFYYQYIDPTQFSNIVLAYGFMAVIAGGRGAHGGAIFGAAAVMALLEGSRFLKDLVPALDSDQLAAIRIIIIGVGLILLLIYRPQGFMREYRLKVSP